MKPEPFNPFYLLLLAVSVVFVMTCLAYALLPWNEQPDWLRRYGWQVLLVEVAGVVLFGLLSMALDRIRALRKSAPSTTMPDAPKENPHPGE
jgi:hypothetical protein